MKRLALALVLAAFSASAARAIGPEIGPYRPIGGVGGSITTIINSDGNLDIADPSGPSADITLGANVVVKNASNTFGIATTQNFQATTFMPPASSVCAPGAGQLCFDTNGTTGLGGALGVYDVGGTDYYLPSLTQAQIGTAGTKRAIGIGAGNAAEVTPLTTTPTANAIPLADGAGKLADGWLSALVSLLGQTIEIGEIAAGDKSGNGTDLATTTGAQTSGDCVEIDANGNHVASGDPCGTGSGSTLLAQASAPANPGAGTFTFWFDTIAEQIKAVLSDGTIHSLLRRQNGAITTGALLRWDGAQATEIPGASADGTTGIITAPGFVSTNNTAPQPVRHAGMTSSCATDGAYFAAFQMSLPNLACQNFTAGGLTAIRPSAIPVNQSRGLNLRALTFTLNSFGLSAGWEADESVELIMIACTTLDSTAAEADCTEVDRFVFQNSASPALEYGGSLADNRTALSCTTGACALTWPIDGLGKSGSNGTVSFAAGAVKYLILGFNAANTNFTADGDGPGAGAQINGFFAQIAIDYEN
jgi:hypothetical protein